MNLETLQSKDLPSKALFMLSAVLIKENKSYIKISFVKGHRQRDEMRQALKRIAA